MKPRIVNLVIKTDMIKATVQTMRSTNPILSLLLEQVLKGKSMANLLEKLT
jgi:hypothetical protein